MNGGISLQRISFLISTTIFLTGCSQQVTEPFTWSLSQLATTFQGSYGLAIIALTLIIRFLLLPLTVRQWQSSKKFTEKMAIMKPEMDEITEKYRAKEQPVAMQQELQAVYTKHDTSLFATLSGCLLALLQMPIFLALYYAIREDSLIAQASFLGISLGQASIWIALIVLFFYGVQAYIQSKSMTQMRLFAYVTPIVMGFVAMIVPAALSLYWAVSGIFLVLQTMIFQLLK